MTPLDLIEFRRFTAISVIIFMIAILVIMVRHLSKEISTRPDWLDRLGNRGAIAMIVFFIGEVFNRVWGWFLLGALNRGMDVGDFENQYHFGLSSLAIMAIGSLGIVYAYSPAKWGHWGWIGATLITAAIAGLLIWLT